MTTIDSLFLVQYFKSIMDSIVAKGMTVRELKERLVREAYEQGIEFPLAVDRSVCVYLHVLKCEVLSLPN